MTQLPQYIMLNLETGRFHEVEKAEPSNAFFKERANVARYTNKEHYNAPWSLDEFMVLYEQVEYSAHLTGRQVYYIIYELKAS